MDKYTKEAAYSYTLGMSITVELLENHPELVEKVLYSSKIIDNAYFARLKKICLSNMVPLIEDDRTIDLLSVKENCYVVAYFRKFTNHLTADSHIVISGLIDKGDLGTILRTCISFNMRNIAIIDNDSDWFEPKIIRSSMGAIFYCNIERFKDLYEYKNRFPDNHLYCFDDEHGNDIGTFKIEDPFSIVFGKSDFPTAELFTIKKAKDVVLPLPLVCGISLASLYARD